MNATEAIVRSAVLYVLRLLIREALPLNEGLMGAITLILPQGMLNPAFVDDPQSCPAIVGGNVETSQRIVDVLLKAFGLAEAGIVLLGEHDGAARWAEFRKASRSR